MVYTYKNIPKVGAFRAHDTETCMVLAHTAGLVVQEEAVELAPDAIEESLSPLWRLRGTGGGRVHPYQSPTEPVRRFIAFYTKPGDLVVDPFAGGGTTLKVAVGMGRRAIGYEIVEEHIQKAQHRLGQLKGNRI